MPTKIHLVKAMVFPVIMYGYESWIVKKAERLAFPFRNAGDPGSIPGSGKFPGEGNGNPLQYSCLGNPMDTGTWWATVHGVAKSQTRLGDFTFTFTYNLVNWLSKHFPDFWELF